MFNILDEIKDDINRNYHFFKKNSIFLGFSLINPLAFPGDIPLAVRGAFA